MANLTERLEAALDEPTRTALAEISVLSAPETAAGPAARSVGFEEIVGPLDRIASAVRTLAPLARSPGSADVLIEAYEYLRRRYVQLVGIILSEVTGAARLPSSTDWTRLNDFADRLSKVSRHHDTVVFTLNYDTLLESALLERHAGWFYDGFAGVSLSFNHPLDRRPGTIGAYHLHGSALWFQDPSGAVRKVRSDSLRRQGLLDDWISGSQTNALPVVVLSDLKSHAIARYPFDLLYQELWSELTTASTLVIAGYGFGDRPINALVAQWMRRSAGLLEVWSRDQVRAHATAVDRLRLEDGSIGRLSSFSVELPDPDAVDALEARLRRSSR